MYIYIYIVYIEVCWLCWYYEPITVTQWYKLFYQTTRNSLNLNLVPHHILLRLAEYGAATPRWLLRRQFGDLCAVLVLWAHNRDSAVQIFSHHKKQFSTYTLFRTILCYQKLLSGRLRKDYSEICWLCWYHTLLLENLSGRLDYLEICWLCWYDEPLTVTQWYTLIDASHHTLTVFSNTHVFCCVCFLVCEVTHHFTHKKTNTLNIYPNAHHILLPLAEKLLNFGKDLHISFAIS